MKRVHSRESASSEKKKKKISVKLKSSSDGKSSKSVAKAKGTTKGKATTDADQFSLEAVLENGGNMAEYDRLKVRRAVCSYRVAQQRPEGGPCNHTRWARSKSVQFHQKGGVAAFFFMGEKYARGVLSCFFFSFFYQGMRIESEQDCEHPANMLSQRYGNTVQRGLAVCSLLAYAE